MRVFSTLVAVCLVATVAAVMVTVAPRTRPADAQAAASPMATEFARLAAEGQGALAAVESFTNDGHDHVPLGLPVRYRTDPPTSGNHWPQWADPGRYNEVVQNEALVHSLEHGHIVIYIDRPNAEAVRLLTLWSNMYRGIWDGILVVPRPNLGGQVILTAWTKMLKLPAFEPAAVAAFIDQYRGRGPETPVR